MKTREKQNLPQTSHRIREGKWVTEGLVASIKTPFYFYEQQKKPPMQLLQMIILLSVQLFSNSYSWYSSNISGTKHS